MSLAGFFSFAKCEGITISTASKSIKSHLLTFFFDLVDFRLSKSFKLGQGYHHRPELTAQKFVELPGRPGRWYRTGDGGILRGKELEVVGRFDSQARPGRDATKEARKVTTCSWYMLHTGHILPTFSESCRRAGACYILLYLYVKTFDILIPMHLFKLSIFSSKFWVSSR